MARKKVAVAINDGSVSDESFSLLLDIKAKTDNKGYGYYNPKGLEELVDKELIEINYELKNPKNSETYAVRTTEKGNILTMAKKNVAVAEDNADGFEVIAFNPSAIKPKAPTARRGRQSKYNLDRLEIGQSIFVVCNDKHDTSEALVKSLAGTIQATNKKYAVETGEVKTIARKNRKSGEIETKTTPVMSMTRRYEAYAYTHNGIDGAAIVRSA